MDELPKVNALRAEAELAMKQLRGLSAEDFKAMKAQVEALRNARQYDLMAKLAEAISRVDPDDPKIRRLYAQALIELGYASAAVDLLKALAGSLDPGHPERAEATGLLGRAYKQMFFEARDRRRARVRAPRLNSTLGRSLRRC